MPAMLSKLTRLGLGLLVLVPAACPSATAIAQTAPPPTTVCMARAGNNPDSPTFVAVIPASEQANMAAKGFALHACSVDAGELAAYRAKVCHLADAAPQVVQGQFEQEYNITPRALCDMANMIAVS